MAVDESGKKRDATLADEWVEKRKAVLARDGNICQSCGEAFAARELDVHHLVPRSMGGSDDLSNLLTLCDGCHATHHPNCQITLSRRFIERWGCRLAGWLDHTRTLPEGFEQLGAALRLLGLTSFRESQLDVILAAMRGQDVLFVSPTGSGKTLCFQIPAILRPGMVLVVSPLKALMADMQVRMQRQKIPATFINSALGREEKEARWAMVRRGMFKFLYCAPERFDEQVASQTEARRAGRIRPAFLVIDEAHCIVRWGHDFRPSYGALGGVHQKIGSPPVMALTASAGVETQKTIISSLGMNNPVVIVKGVDRPNIGLLRLRTYCYADKFGVIHKLLNLKILGKAMIFVPTVRIGDMVKEHLRDMDGGIPFYHSKLPEQEKESILGRFSDRLQPKLDKVICTNAFGMGLDIPDIRLVVHWQPPESAEAYLQEFGRAGRNGMPALAVVLPMLGDKELICYMAEKTKDRTEKYPTQPYIPGLEDPAQDELARMKMQMIEKIYLMADPWSGCFRRQLIEYFCGGGEPKPMPWSARILNWLFSAKVTKSKVRICCDQCNHIDMGNYMETASKILER